MSELEAKEALSRAMAAWHRTYYLVGCDTFYQNTIRVRDAASQLIAAMDMAENERLRAAAGEPT